MTKWGLFQECKTGLTFKNPSMKFTMSTNNSNNKNKHVIISIDAGKHCTNFDIYSW